MFQARCIESIVVERHYDAWGEFADLVADNSELTELAEKYMNSTGIAKQRAEAEMITYIVKRMRNLSATVLTGIEGINRFLAE